MIELPLGTLPVDFLTLFMALFFLDFEKKFPASACQKKKIACSTNVIESLWEKKGEKNPAHQIARKKYSL